MLLMLSDEESIFKKFQITSLNKETDLATGQLAQNEVNVGLFSDTFS